MKVNVTTNIQQRKLQTAAENQSEFILRRAAYETRANIRKLIRTSPVYASPGRPPHTRQGQLRKSILYAKENKKKFVVGTSRHLFSTLGKSHEHGGIEKKAKRYDYRNVPLSIGKPGPIAYPSKKDPKLAVWIRIRNQKQLQIARIIQKKIKPFVKMTIRKYPKRPFAKPGLQRTLPYIKKLGMQYK